MSKRYDESGQRVTDCCGSFSTYMDAGDGSEVLCCKTCYNEVDFGEGDGSEYADEIPAQELESFTLSMNDMPFHPRHGVK